MNFNCIEFPVGTRFVFSLLQQNIFEANEATIISIEDENIYENIILRTARLDHQTQSVQVFDFLVDTLDNLCFNLRHSDLVRIQLP